MEQQHCFNHPDRKAISFCHHCNNYYCPECLREGPEYYYCQRPDCLKALEAELQPPALSVAPVEPVETPPENLIYLALYPNASEVNAVKIELESEGLESFAVESSCGSIEEPFIGPIWLGVRESDEEKASQALKSFRSTDHSEPIETVMSYLEPQDAENAKSKLASLGIQSFLWDSLSPKDNQIYESFSLLTRASDVERATNLLVVPESE